MIDSRSISNGLRVGGSLWLGELKLVWLQWSVFSDRGRSQFIGEPCSLAMLPATECECVREPLAGHAMPRWGDRLVPLPSLRLFRSSSWRCFCSSSYVSRLAGFRSPVPPLPPIWGLIEPLLSGALCLVDLGLGWSWTVLLQLGWFGIWLCWFGLVNLLGLGWFGLWLCCFLLFDFVVDVDKIDIASLIWFAVLDSWLMLCGSHHDDVVGGVDRWC